MSDQRDLILQATNDSGLMARPVWRLLNRLSPYEACPAMQMVSSRSLESRVVNLPSSVSLSVPEV